MKLFKNSHTDFEASFTPSTFVLVLLVNIFGVLNFGCKSSDPDVAATDNDFLKVTIKGENFQNQSTFGSGGGFDNQSLCDNKNGYYANVFDFTLNSRFTISTDIFHYRNNNDFKSTGVGSYSVSQGPNIYNRSCNLTFSVNIQDYSTSSNKTTQLLSGSHNVTKIKQISSTSTSTKYQVAGTFTASFQNSANDIIPVTGSYQTTITVYN